MNYNSTRCFLSTFCTNRSYQKTKSIVSFSVKTFLLMIVLFLTQYSSATAQTANTPYLCSGYNPICASAGQTATLCASYSTNDGSGNGVNSVNISWFYSSDGNNWSSYTNGPSSITTSVTGYYRYTIDVQLQL